MSIKDDFLDEIHVGDYVTVYYGSQMCITGTVTKLTDSSVRVQAENTSPRIALDSIISYDTPEQSKEHTDAAQSVSEVPEISTVLVSPALIGAQALAAYFQDVVPLSINDVADWESHKKGFEVADLPRELRNAVRGAISSFSNIVQQMPLPLKMFDDKMHNISAKIHCMAKQYADMQDDLYGLLASMYLQLEDFEKSEKFFAKTRCFLELVYATDCGKQTDRIDQYLDNYVRAPNRLDPYAYCLYAQSACNRKSVLALSQRVLELQRIAQLGERGCKELECLSACAFLIARDGNLPLQWTAMYSSRAFALKCLSRFIIDLPADWVHVDVSANNHIKLLDPPKKDANARLHISTIKHFDTSKLFGHIKAAPSDYFFYINQVNKDDVLRRVLSFDHLSDNLEVSFYLGKSPTATDRPAAYCVALTERGASEAARRLKRIEQEDVTGASIQYGVLEEYQHERGFGRIYIQNNVYRVIDREIIDPHLLGYLKLSYTDSFNIPVAFYAKKDKNEKDIAVKVHCADDSIQLSESDIRSLICMRELRQEEIDAWPSKKQQIENQEPAMEDIPDLYDRPYIPLEPVDESNLPAAKAATDPSAIAHQDVPTPATSSASTSQLPPLEPLPEMGENQFRNLEPLRGQYYEDARSQMTNGNLREAERLYICAIRANDKIESSIADLVTVFLRDENRIQDAVKLMDVYGDRLTDDKRMNLQLQIYQKSHARPYRIKLCYLLDEVIGQPIKINAKLHYLALQGTTLRNLGEFGMALNSYRRWHQIYDSEVQYRGQNAVSQFASALNFVRRGEAICHYWIGNRARAEELAKELLRISSNDEAAQRILAGTLQKNTNELSDLPENQESFMLLSEEEVVLGGTDLSSFANNRLKEISLSKWMKSYALKDGEYLGDPNKAKEDISFLLDAQGQTPSARSARQLCAAKIIVSIQDRFGEDKSKQASLRSQRLTEADAKKHVARSMAAYGDATLEEQQETDTARYAYLQAIEMLPVKETDWKKSVNHYLQSYFHGRQDMAQIVTRNNQSSQQKGVDLSVIQNAYVQDPGEFVVGIVRLRKVIRQIKNSDLRFQLDSALHNSSLFDAITNWLSLHGISDDYADQDKFSKAMDLAEENSQNIEQEFAEYVGSLHSGVLSRINGESLLRNLSSQHIRDWLCSADQNRLDKTCKILEDFRSYFTNNDFQHRSGRFEHAIKQIVELTQLITAYPTKLSYEILLPELESTRSQLQEARDQHYRSFPPEIRVGFTEGIQPYLNNDEVRVHLTIYNGNAQGGGAERQLADNIKIEVSDLGQGIEFIQMETDISGHIYGGKSIETILIFRITDSQILALGTFDWKVRCTYRYNALPTEIQPGEVSFNESVVFQRGRHEKIQNPFANYVGKEMGDEEMFKGRDGIIQELLDTILANGTLNYGHGILLYGQTRAGKSSIRLHFARKVRRNFPNVILVDMQNLGGGLNEPTFYTSLLDALQLELDNRHPDVSLRLSERNVESPRERSDKIQSQANYAQLLFTRYMKLVYEVIRSMGKMLLLITDEFSEVNTAIKDKRMPADFMQTWKALLENYGLFAVCFGQDDTPLFARMNQNAFARMDQKKVTYLAKGPAKELMDSPIALKRPDGSLKSRYTPAALDELYDLTAGSAYLILKLCALLVDYLNSKGAEYVTPGILQNFLQTSVFKGNNCITEQYFEPQLGDRSDKTLYEINRKVLLDIARNSQSNGWAEIQSLSVDSIEPRSGQLPQNRLSELLDRLQERDVIEIEENQRCRIKVSLLTRWLLYTHGRG